jgi:hypothetical protein
MTARTPGCPIPTKQEILVVKAVIECGGVGPAAVKLSASPHTVDRHLDNLRDKFDLHTFAQIVAYGYEHGWL